ncbi:MAG: rhomboid family intramembrane serine protease [Deltaproteobacteria bacterium]|nr:rhomboid family intramembrane serine protease [Deltaproteobacteria bacterium]
MERLLARLERTFLGKIAIERLTTFIVGGMTITIVLGMARPEFFEHLVLVPQLVAQQPWRLVTFLFLPPPASNMLWLFFALYFTWLMGSNLESEWGTLKFNVFYLVGTLGTIAAAFITGAPQGNYFLNLTLFLAFATLFPDYEIRLFFLIPIKVKWLALLDGGYLTLLFVQGTLGTRAAIIAALANYFLFFAGHLVALLKGRRLLVRQAARRAEQRPQVRESSTRACAICGAKQEDGADIRVCACEKCGGPRDLCLEHARNH